MLSTRLLRQQSSSRICAVCQLRYAHRGSRRSGSRREERPPERQHPSKPTAKNGIRSSLLDELFPPTADRPGTFKAFEDEFNSKFEALVSGASEPEILDLSRALQEELEAESFAAESQGISSVQQGEPQIRTASNIVILASVSKSLLESDFMRLGTKGEHIAGWTGGITKVIPRRDEDGLQPFGYYFLVFSTPAAALAYRDQVLRLHKLAQNQTPTFTNPKMLPPPGYIENNEDIYALIKGYTLVPPFQKHPIIRVLNIPIPPVVQELVTHGGHKIVQSRLPKSNGKVLLSLYGKINASEIRKAISRDGSERNLEWNLWGHNDIVQIGAGNMADITSAEYDDRLQSQQHKAFGPAKFILTFKDANEARRFIREWHRRPFRQSDEHVPDGLPPLVNAEMLW